MQPLSLGKVSTQLLFDRFCVVNSLITQMARADTASIKGSCRKAMVAKAQERLAIALQGGKWQIISKTITCPVT